jgi:hypothetical protein
MYDNDPSERRLALFLIFIVAVGAFLGLWLSPGRAYSAEPYGGCDEAWQAPHSEGADWCREHGWTVRSRFVIGPKGWLRANRLPDCRQEDSLNCWWDAKARGNGKGRSFVIVGTEDHDALWYVKGQR